MVRLRSPFCKIVQITRIFRGFYALQKRKPVPGSLFEGRQEGDAMCSRPVSILPSDLSFFFVKSDPMLESPKCGRIARNNLTHTGSAWRGRTRSVNPITPSCPLFVPSSIMNYERIRVLSSAILPCLADCGSIPHRSTTFVANRNGN